MKVTYVGNTERNGKKRKVTYTGTLGPSAAQEKRGPKATYIGVDTSKGSSDGVAWHTDKAAMQANKEYFSSKKQNDYNISALGAGNYGADKQANEGYNYGKGLLKAGGMGLSAIARDVTTPLAFGERTVAKGWNALFGNIAPMNERGFFNAWDENIALEQEGLQQKYAENTAKGGQYAEKGENLLASAVEALPSLAIAFASGGTSAAAKAGTLAAQTAAKSSPALGQTLKNVAAARAKDPNYLSSAAQIFSHSYNDAKEEGVDDKRAALYAIGNALLGSEIEISGGIQNLPGKVANQAAWRTLVNTMLDEGKEEVLQGIIDRTLQNAVYDADNPYFGVNENAIFDPGTAAEEFAGGAIVGGLLSGGTMGVNTLANRVAYGAAKAQYNRDVQQNTAPEMNAKSAEAVEAVTRGETITGNQAAAIARDPVAVEVLEQRTGVKLDTDKPISQVKRAIAGLASREVTQETQRATPPSPAVQKRAEKRVGGFLENGQKAYQEMSRTAEDAPSLYAGFSSVYNAGLNGIEADKAKGKYAAMLTPEQRYAAYNAGLEDARAQVARENAEVASVTTTAGAGLADNEYSRYLIAAKKDTAATLNTWGKKLGVRIEIVDQVLGGRANGQYIKEQNLIQIAADSGKPLLNVTAHEITHRMQDLSPAEYRKFRQSAVEYKMRENGADTEAEIVERYMETAEQEGVTLTRDEVMDELAADFAGDMLDDAGLFAKFSKENRTAAQKLLDSLKEFLNKVKTAFTGKYRDMAAQEAYGKDFAELEDIAKQWQAAFDAAKRQAVISSSVRTGDTVQYDDAVYSLRVTDKDTLDFLDKQKTITTYKTMQLVDGKLYPPMAARVDGRYEDASELGKWEMAVERPDLVKDGKFKLDKGKGQGSLMAAYNPYMHSSNLVLNDQFSGAYTRDNLVTVECEVPASEMTSGYHADGAKDSVGWHSWHTGTVAGQVRKVTGMERQVFLSRWIKPVRILSNAEVAGMYKELLGNTGIAVPDNVVTPGLLAELKKAGVPIKESGRVKTAAGEGDGVRYSLKTIIGDSGRNYGIGVYLDSALLENLTAKEREQMVKERVKELGGQHFTAYDGNGNTVDVQIAAPNARFVNKNGKSVPVNKDLATKNRGSRIKQEAVVLADELVSAARYKKSRPANYPHGWLDDNGRNEWAEWKTYIQDKENSVWEATLHIATSATGEKFLYDIDPIKMAEQSGNSDTSTANDSIPADGVNVKPQFSLKATDSTGRKLSEQQQEYFKDSKVRDAEGRLKTVYHGSSAQFTKFSADFMSKNGSSEGQGFYFTDLKTMAQGYEKDGGQLLEGYLDIKNPLSDSEVTLSNAEVKRLIMAIDPTGDDLVLNYDSRGGMGYPSRTWYNRAVNDTLRLTMETSESDSEILAELANGMGDPGAVLKAAREVLGYDGYIVEGKYDDATVYVAFDSSQFKNVDNLNPTSDPDIRLSLKATAEVEREARELKKERNALAKQNEALKQRVQELKGEMRISKEPSVVARDVKKLGLNLIREYGSDVKYADVQSEMDALAKAVMKRDVTMEDLMPHAKAVAEAIVDNTTELTEHGAELLEIRDYLKRQKILFNGDMANYGDFRKSHMGTLKLNKSNGTPVDTVYGELAEMFGEGYFPGDVYTEADMLLQIGDVLDSMDTIYENPFDSYRDAAIQEIANDIIDGMISDQVRQKKTYADRRALEKQEAVGRVREMLTKEREKRRDMVKRMRREYNEKTQKGREKRYATEMRAKIARHTGAISEKLLRPTDKKHVPEELRVVVAALLRNINLESAYSYDENGRPRKNADGDPTQRTLAAEKLKKAYEDIIEREGNIVVDPDLLDSGGLLDRLAALGDKRIADMNVTELEAVWNTVRAIETTLTSYDRTLANQKYARTSEWAESLMMGSISRKRRNRKISLDMADPYTFFSAYGDGGMQVYRTLRNAQDREHVMLMELRNAAKKFLDADVYKNRGERHTFPTSRGVELTLTTDQIMNLYNLARRGEQAMHHLTVGGIVQPEIQRNGKLKAIPRGNDNILLTEEDIKAITSVLTPEQIKVANGLQKLASTKLAEWGNEASMQVYGYRKFKEENYWPIKAAKDAVASSVEKDADNARSIKNMGSAKALTPNASNALDIGGAYDVFAQNASDMIKYATLLAPMEDINRLYNYRYRDSMGNLTGKNVRQVLSGVYGDAAQSYWRNLMRDVQNGMVKSASSTTRTVERIVGNTKGAAVGANLRVIIQQPTAYCRAAVVLEPENMTKGLTKGATAGNGWDKARKWAAIAGIKDTSGFDQGSRYTISREVYGSDGNVREWLNDKSMALAGKADAVTWGKIWNACEWQVAANTNTEVGSDAYYRQVAELFTDVIDQTQVVDGVMQRTQIMRDSDALTRQATSFMGEPLKSLNVLMRAYDAWVYETNPHKRGKALKQLKRSVGALLVTDVVNALAQSIVDGLRDDDKDKNWAERILEAFTGYSGDEKNAGEAAKNVVLGGNLISNINPVGRIPYLKDILSILQGYTVDRMDAAAADDIIRTSKTFIKGLGGDSKTTTAYNLKQVMLMCSKVFGISVGNMGRDMWSIARSIANDTGNVRVMFEMEKAIYRMDRSAGNRKRWCELLYRAQKDKDTETARLIYKEMLEHGYEESDVRQGVEAIMKNEQGVESVKELKNRWRAP